ncbi:hypothetical protein ABZX40_33285 [Streptomyces sp. NPDC004610]|uniref:hypothetical protein n=1 Tax=unclassified Streptomyces TaxID=2593676 RepID=UPI0033B1AF9E
MADPGTHAPSFTARDRWPDAFELTRRSRAVIGKPGAGTLIDSLNAATPVLFTEPLGNWERANRDVWCALGFGMEFADWFRAPDHRTLTVMHERLRTAVEMIPSYPDRLVTEGFPAMVERTADT